MTMRGFPKVRGPFWGDPFYRDYTLLGSILGHLIRKPPRAYSEQHKIRRRGEVCSSQQSGCDCYHDHARVVQPSSMIRFAL